MKENKKKPINIVISILKFSILIIIIVVIPAYILIFKKDLITSFKSLEEVTDLIRSYGKKSVIAYITIQVFQIVISIIPGQFFQIAAGYIFGFFPSLLYSCIGAVIGASICYFLASFLGRDAIGLFINHDKIDFLIEKMNTKKAYVIVFFIYLIPGFPKDIMGYAAGLSNMKYKAFVLVSTAGRTPAMAMSIFIGLLIDKERYMGVGIMVGLAIIIFIICMIKRKAIMQLIDKLYKKLNE